MSYYVTKQIMENEGKDPTEANNNSGKSPKERPKRETRKPSRFRD